MGFAVSRRPRNQPGVRAESLYEEPPDEITSLGFMLSDNKSWTIQNAGRVGEGGTPR
jgi:hypothetical protein